MATIAGRIARFAASLRVDGLPDEVAGAAKLHALDTLGCGIAVLHALRVPEPLAPSDAAFVNGTLCHALDFDDTHPHSIVHVSASVVPAALASPPRRGWRTR